MSPRNGQTIGGQAFPGGVMMRNGSKAALAVRLRSGDIKIISRKLPVIKSSKLSKIPVVKNIISFFFTLIFSFYGIFRFLQILPKSIKFMSPLDILRYHGAEHKTIRCYESGLELTEENILPQTRFHPRCGTGLVVFILMSEILAFIFIPRKFYKAHYDLISAIAFLIGLILGYESITYASKVNTKFARILLKPAMFAQRFTVLEPRPDMVECAVAALNEVL